MNISNELRDYEKYFNKWRLGIITKMKFLKVYTFILESEPPQRPFFSFFVVFRNFAHYVK